MNYGLFYSKSRAGHVGQDAASTSLHPREMGLEWFTLSGQGCGQGWRSPCRGGRVGGWGRVVLSLLCGLR